MINFRYHIVSITAVFLALAIGTALGSTFLDGPTVDLLNRNIRSAEDRIEASNAENGRLSELNQAAQEREDGLLTDGSGRLFAPMLTDEPVLVMVAPGVDPGESTGLAEVLAASGADLRAVVDLKDEMLLLEDFDEDLALALGLEEVDDVDALRAEVYEQLIFALTAAGREAPPEPEPEVDSDEQGADPGTTSPDVQGEPEGRPDLDTTTTSVPDATGDGEEEGEEEGETSGAGGEDPDGLDPEGPDEPVLDGSQPEIITILEQSGYISVDRRGDDADPILETPGYRFVLLTGVETSASQQQAALRLLEADVEVAPMPLVIVASSPPEIDDAGSEVSTLIEVIRDDDGLSGRYSTVDNVDRFSGVTALILLLDEIGTINPGHYGQGPGAQAVLPAAP